VLRLEKSQREYPMGRAEGPLWAMLREWANITSKTIKIRLLAVFALKVFDFEKATPDLQNT
jgi:hypothetical protein